MIMRNAMFVTPRKKGHHIEVGSEGQAWQCQHILLPQLFPSTNLGNNKNDDKSKGKVLDQEN